MSVGEGGRVDLSRNQSGFVSNIGEVEGANRVSNCSHFGVVNLTRIGGATTNHYFGFDIFRTFGNLVVVKDASFGIDGVEVGIKKARSERDGFAGVRKFPAVTEMSSVVEIHGEHFVAGIKERGVDGEVSETAGCRLDVNVPDFFIESEEFESPRLDQALDLIDKLIALVVAFTRLTFTIFVHEDASDGFLNCVGNKVFAGNHGKILSLSFGFGLDKVVDFRISFGKSGHRAII